MFRNDNLDYGKCIMYIRQESHIFVVSDCLTITWQQLLLNKREHIGISGGSSVFPMFKIRIRSVVLSGDGSISFTCLNQGDSQRDPWSSGFTKKAWYLFKYQIIFHQFNFQTRKVLLQRFTHRRITEKQQNFSVRSFSCELQNISFIFK